MTARSVVHRPPPFALRMLFVLAGRHGLFYTILEDEVDRRATRITHRYVSDTLNALRAASTSQ